MPKKYFTPKKKIQIKVTKTKQIKITKNYSFENIHKLHQNKLFVSSVEDGLQENGLCLHSIKDQPWFIGTFDSKEQNTSKTFLAKGLHADNLLIIESNPAIAQLHLRAGIPCHHGSLLSFTNYQQNKSYFLDPEAAYYKYFCAGFFFDMCGQVITYHAQILQAIHLLNITHGTVFAFTFTRVRMAIQHHNHAWKTFLQDVKTLIAAKGLQAKMIVHKYEYAGDGHGARGAPMVFCILKATHDFSKPFTFF